MDELQDLLVKKLEFLMKEKRISPHELAKISNLSINLLAFILNKEVKPSLDMIKCLADGLGVKLKDLLDFDPPSTIPPRIISLMQGQDDIFYATVERMAVLSHKRILVEHNQETK